MTESRAISCSDMAMCNMMKYWRGKGCRSSYNSGWCEGLLVMMQQY